MRIRRKGSQDSQGTRFMFWLVIYNTETRPSSHLSVSCVSGIPLFPIVDRWNVILCKFHYVFKRGRMGKLLRIARVQADSNVQGMWIQKAVLSNVAHTFWGSAPSPVPAAIVVLPQMCLVRKLCSCTRTAARAFDDELGQCEQDLCEYHSRAQQTTASCLLPRVLALHRFPAQQRNNSDDQAQNRRTQNR